MPLLFQEGTFSEEINYNLRDRLIQVCYDVSDFSTKKKEVENLVKASEKLRCDSLRVITWDYEGVEEAGGKKVEFVKAWKWFLSV